MPKATTTKKNPKCCSSKNIKEEIHKMGDELEKLAKKAKTKYDKADDKTKKKIIAGVAGAAALIAGAIGVKKITNKKKK